jgi:hypothetical protein
MKAKFQGKPRPETSSDEVREVKSARNRGLLFHLTFLLRFEGNV